MGSSKSIHKKLTGSGRIGRDGGFIIGIDEVGRGPVAGPVSVVALRMKKSEFQLLRSRREFKGIHNSKALTKKQREEWYKKILKWKREGRLNFSYSSSSAKTIDEIGISKSISKCVKRSLISVKATKFDDIRLDGSLYAPEEYRNQKTIIGGDEKEIIISLASIVAKVRRDSYMTKLATTYSDYAFDKNVGYGTKEHMQKIRKCGLSKEHRKTFLRSLAM